MGPNHLRHLQFELERLHSLDKEQLKACDCLERDFRRKSELVDFARFALQVAELQEKSVCEAYRASHRARMTTRQEIGEIQDELFALGEDEEDHYH